MIGTGYASEHYRQEIAEALESDGKQRGVVYRMILEGGDEDHQRIADDLGITTGPVRQTIYEIRTLLDRVVLTSKPTVAERRAGMIRGFLKDHQERLSQKTIDALTSLQDEHHRVSKDENAIVGEHQAIERETDEVVSKSTGGIQGIYVYSYPHYLKYPVLPSDEDDSKSRTYLKLGRSDVDIDTRVKQQIWDAGVTALPEPPIILRMYTCPGENVAEIETVMKRHFNDADQDKTHQVGAGREWFLTHLRFIDSTAKLLNLSLEYAHPEYQP